MHCQGTVTYFYKEFSYKDILDVKDNSVQFIDHILTAMVPLSKEADSSTNVLVKAVVAKRSHCTEVVDQSECILATANWLTGV